MLLAAWAIKGQWVKTEEEAWKMLMSTERVPPEYCKTAQRGARAEPRRIFYTALFGGYDLDQLEALLFEVADVVHRFIVMEADSTFQGRYRTRSLPALLEPGGRLAQYAGKLVVEPFTMPEPWRCREEGWLCEGRQRQAVLGASVRAGMERGRDILVLADTDEILSRAALSFLADCDFGDNPMVVPLPSLVYSLYWEYVTHSDVVVGPSEFFLDQAAPLAYFRRVSPKPFAVLYPYVTNGWHLSFFGGPEMVRLKILSYVHSEWNKAPYNTVGFIKKGMWEGLDPFRRGPLIPVANMAHLRIVGTHRAYECWLEPLNSSCRSHWEAKASLQPITDCWGRFVNAHLERVSGVVARRGMAADWLQGALMDQQERCKAIGEPTVYLLCRADLHSYLNRLVQWSADEGLAEFLRAAGRGHFGGRRARGQRIAREDAHSAVWGLCLPVQCLAEGTAATLQAAHRFLLRRLLLRRGRLNETLAPEVKALPVWRHEHLKLELLSPASPLEAKGRRGPPRPLRPFVGLLPGTAGDRRLVLAVAAGSSEAPLHVLLGSLRRAQVAAHVAVVATDAGALAACERASEAYGAACIAAKVLQCAEQKDRWDDAELASEREAAPRPPWLCWEQYLTRLAPEAEEVLLLGPGLSILEADPFELRARLELRLPAAAARRPPGPAHRRSAAAEGAAAGPLLVAEPTDLLLADSAWYTTGCPRCAGLAFAQGGSSLCEAVGEFPVLHGGLVIGSREPVLQFLGILRAAKPILGEGCDEMVALNLLAWTGTLAARGAPITVATSEASGFCALSAAAGASVPAARPARFGAFGEVLDHRGRPCAVLRSQAQPPGGGRDADGGATDLLWRQAWRRFVPGAEAPEADSEPPSGMGPAPGDGATPGTVLGAAAMAPAAHCTSQHRLQPPRNGSRCAAELGTSGWQGVRPAGPSAVYTIPAQQA